jgi:uncharacterized protein (TIGR02266 family)
MHVKTILIAHRQSAVRDRYAAALADARHAFVTAGTEAAACAAAADTSTPVSLALLDLGLTDDTVTFVRSLRQAAGRALPIVVFAGTVGSAEQIRTLLGLNIGGYINEHAATPQILPALAPHLFPDNFNRRTSHRVALGVPISYRAGPAISGALTLNIGKGGVAIRTLSPLQVETRVHLKFRLPGATTEITAEGRVAWGDRKVGMGIQFDRLNADDQAAIDAFVEGHES